MTILNFQHHIGESTLKKGTAYFRKGKVSDLLFWFSQWSAYVQGTDKYVVYIDMEGRHITHTYCNCKAFHQGDHCKHVVAVLYKILETYYRPSPKDKLYPADTISYLGQLDAEDLRLFILDQMRSNPEMASNLNEFCLIAKDQAAVTSYIDQINNAIVHVANIQDEGPSDLGKLCAKPANRLLDQAANLYRSGEVTGAFDILFAIISKASGLQESLFDKRQYYIEVVENAFKLLDEIADRVSLNEYDAARLTRRAWEGLKSESLPIYYYEVHWLEILIRHGWQLEGKKEELLEMIKDLERTAREEKDTEVLTRIKAAQTSIKKNNFKKYEKSQTNDGNNNQSTLMSLPLPVEKSVPAEKKVVKAPAISEKKAAYLLKKKTYLSELKAAEKKGDPKVYKALQYEFIGFMQKGSEVLALREWARKFYEQTKDSFFYEAFKDTYMLSEWEALTKAGKPGSGINAGKAKNK